MPMTRCSECDEDVSSDATVCPHCGHRLKRSLVVPILLAVAAACTLLVAAFFVPPFLNPSDAEQLSFHDAYLVGILLACANSVEIALIAIAYAVKNKALAATGVICAFASIGLLAFGFTLSSEFFLLVPLMLAAPTLIIIAAVKARDA